MSTSRLIEVTAWTAGIVLLTAYAGMRTWSAYASDRGVDAMRQARAQHATATTEKEGPASLHAVRQDLLTATQPDTSTWARKRLAQYEQTLTYKVLPEAVLRIPRLRLEVPVYEGTSELTLNRGAGRITGTARIDGDAGNIGLAAHRDGFFRPLKDISVGDALFLDTVGETRQYRVTRLDIVGADNVSVLADTSSSTVTLVTCYPFYHVGSAPHRFIVRAEIDQRGFARRASE